MIPGANEIQSLYEDKYIFMKWEVYVINQEMPEKLIVKQKRFYFSSNKFNMKNIQKAIF